MLFSDPPLLQQPQLGSVPVNPLCPVPSSTIKHVIRSEDVCIRILPQQKLVEEREEAVCQIGRECAVRVSADLYESMSVFDTHCLPYCMRGCHASEGTERAEPHEVGIFVGDHGPRRDKSSEEVMVIWEHADVVHVVVEIGREPDVLLYNLHSFLYDAPAVLLELGDTPAGVTTRA